MDKDHAVTVTGVPRSYGIGWSPSAEHLERDLAVTVTGGPGGLWIGRRLIAGLMERFYAFTGGAGGHGSKISTATHDTQTRGCCCLADGPDQSGDSYSVVVTLVDGKVVSESKDGKSSEKAVD